MYSVISGETLHWRRTQEFWHWGLEQNKIKGTHVLHPSVEVLSKAKIMWTHNPRVPTLRRWAEPNKLLEKSWDWSGQQRWRVYEICLRGLCWLRSHVRKAKCDFMTFASKGSLFFCTSLVMSSLTLACSGWHTRKGSVKRVFLAGAGEKGSGLRSKFWQVWWAQKSLLDLHIERAVLSVLRISFG